MLVEFKTIMYNEEESREREIQEELQGMSSVPYERQKDYIANTTIDVSMVVRWEACNVLYNDKPVETVQVRFSDDSWSRPLMITHQEFTILYENVTGIKVKKASDLTHAQSL